ncbi:hypothetical protein RYX36_015302, partial [Vicia faba]
IGESVNPKDARNNEESEIRENIEEGPVAMMDEEVNRITPWRKQITVRGLIASLVIRHHRRRRTYEQAGIDTPENTP